MHALREITSGRNYSPANRKFQPSDGKRVKTWNRSLHVIIRRGRKLLRTKKRRVQKIHSCCREWHDEQRDSPRNYLPSSLKILRGQRLRSCVPRPLWLPRCAPFQFQILSICTERAAKTLRQRRPLEKISLSPRCCCVCTLAVSQKLD